MSGKTTRAARYRARAAELREMAEAARGRETKAEYLRLADEYERLARRLAARPSED